MIVRDDKISVRSRIEAGAWYVGVGGIICIWALVEMRAGVRTIPWPRSGPVPMELIAGIAGIVVFMGLLQLLIAVIVKMRQR